MKGLGWIMNHISLERMINFLNTIILTKRKEQL